jgi:hypothetical protein
MRIGLSLIVGFLVVGPSAGADPVKPADLSKSGSPARIEIFNGPMRTVHYYSSGLSRSDRLLLRDMEQAENEIALADQLAALRQQYVRDEIILERARRQAQEQLYGAVNSYATGVYPDQLWAVDLNAALSFPGNPNLAAFRGAAFPGILPNYAGFPGYFGLNNLYGGVGSLAALGVEEGRLKTELARTLATQATPEYTAMARKNYEMAMERASRSDALARDLNLSKSPIRSAEAEKPPVHVTVTMKGGAKIEGTLLKDEGDRVVVKTADGEMEIRRSETVTILKK